MEFAPPAPVLAQLVAADDTRGPGAMIDKLARPAATSPLMEDICAAPSDTLKSSAITSVTGSGSDQDANDVMELRLDIWVGILLVCCEGVGSSFGSSPGSSPGGPTDGGAVGNGIGAGNGGIPPPQKRIQIHDKPPAATTSPTPFPPPSVVCTVVMVVKVLY